MLKDSVKGFAQRPPVTMGTWAQPPALPWQQAPPLAPAGAHQSVQVAPSWERGAGGRWGRRRRPGLVLSPQPPPPQTSVPTSPGPLPGRSYLPRQGYFRAVPKFHRHTPLPCRLAAVPGDPECTVNTLRPARCPRKCWAASKPRPTPPLAFSGIVRRRPPWLGDPLA